MLREVFLWVILLYPLLVKDVAFFFLFRRSNTNSTFFFGGGAGGDELRTPLYAKTTLVLIRKQTGVVAHFGILARGGGGYSTKFYTGRLRPEVQTLTLLCTIFDRKGTPFIYLLGVSRHFVPFKYLNGSFPYPFTYLQPEKGTPFGRSLPI